MWSLSYDTEPQFLQSHSKECLFSRILWQARGTWTYSNLDPYEIVTCKNSQDNLVALKDKVHNNQWKEFDNSEALIYS